MEKVTSPAGMQKLADELRAQRKRIALVPTMGFLHDGHMSLVAEARRQCDIVVMSVYVNPTQFVAGEDFATYPRDMAHDEKKALDGGVDFLFSPPDGEVYPEGYLTFVEVDKVSRILEGEFRPGHFKGVATIVSKLFNIVKPHVAIFGQKDAQQAFIIRKFVKDLNFGIEIIVAPIIREPDGLAMSSRNVYLSPDERKRALALYHSLKLAGDMLRKGEVDLTHVRDRMTALIAAESEGRIDYIQFVDPNTFDLIGNSIGLNAVQAVLAVRIGKTRLIDNMIFDVRKP